METLEKSSSLETLEKRLYQCFSDQFPSANSLRIECVLEDEKLKVWVWHEPTAFLEEQSAFAAVEKTIADINPPLSSQVRLYLKREGQTQPYAVRAFKISSTGATPPPPLPKVSPTPKAASKIPASDIPEFLEKARQKKPKKVSVRDDRKTSARSFEDLRQWLPLGIAGMTASSILLVGFGYALTRPCVLGDCPQIARSEELSQNAIQNLDAQRSTSALLAAQQKLDEAEKLLQKIPPWSIHHKTARELLAMNRDRSIALDKTSQALSHATLAGQKSQNPPHRPQVWQEVSSLWQKAIADLEQIPESSLTYGFARQKISEYQANLEVIEKRLSLEETAQAQLETARSAAEAAQSRQALARDVEAWQLAHASWKTTLYALRRVPKGTQAAQNAEKLYTAYEPQIIAARDRYTEEQIAANFYNQALTFGDRAQLSQNESEWIPAITQWQQGLAHAQQVSPQTSSSESAQVLISSYTKSLEEAVKSQQRQGRMERANLELATICAATPPICEYGVDRKKIVVKILPAYIDYIRDLTQTSSKTEDKKTQTSIEEHKQALIDSFKAISDRAQLPIELYQKSDGSAIGSYQPQSK
ncbi:MAG: hypothetical protein WBB29_08775 [Geitlerinemataceae cyanobacterium]